MKNIVLMIFLVATSNVFSQSEYNWLGIVEFGESYYQPNEYKPNTDVNKILVSTTSKKGKVKMYQKLYNEKGSLLSYSEIVSERDIQPIVAYLYDANNKIIQRKVYKKGDLKFTYENILNDDGKLLEGKATNSRGVITIRSTWEYNANNCLVKSTRYKKGDKLYRTWEYEYRGECEKEKSMIKNKSGKVLRTWTYDCKEEGQQLELRKKETQVCKWDESTKDYLLKVNQSFDEKGRIFKTVMKYTLTDTLLVEVSRYNQDDKLVYKSTYDNGVSKPLKKESYYKGGIRSSTVYGYDNGRLVEETNNYKGKFRYKHTFKYQDDKLVEKKYYNKKQELIRTVSLAYS